MSFITVQKTRGQFVKQKLVPSSSFTVTKFKNILFWSHFAVPLKSHFDVQQTLYLCWFVKLDLSIRAKCDINHFNDLFEFGHT
jgi:hypothetical protein